jgi:hypothetical protein
VTLRSGIGNSQWAYGSWGDDGSIIFAAPIGTTGLERLSSDGGEAEALTLAEDQWHERPRFLPGAEAIVYQQTTAEGTRIIGRSLDDGTEKVLVDDATDPLPLASGHLLFRRREDLLAAAFDREKLELTGRPTPVDLRALIERPPFLQATMQLAVSGTGVLFYVPDRLEVWQRVLTWYDREKAIAESWSQDHLFFSRLSPDGRRAVISSWHDGRNRIEVLDLDRRLPTRLAEVPSVMLGNALWSSDGSDVFFGTGSTDTGRLYRKSVGDSDPPELMLEVESHWGAIPWSRGPDDVIAISTNNPTDIRFYSPREGGEIATTLDSPFNERQPVFSPDGGLLAYQSDEAGLFEIYIVEYPGGEQKKRVSRGGGSGPLWSPDGTKLYFQSMDGRRFFEVTVESELDGAPVLGEQRLVLEGPFSPSFDLGRMTDITSDGSSFLMMTSPDIREIALEPVVVLDWFPELTRQVPVAR